MRLIPVDKENRSAYKVFEQAWNGAVSVPETVFNGKEVRGA